MGRTIYLWVVHQLGDHSWWWDRQIRTGDLLLAKLNRALLSPVKWETAQVEAASALSVGVRSGPDGLWTKRGPSHDHQLPSRGVHAGMLWQERMPG